jgi:hypothetical protein
MPQQVEIGHLAPIDQKTITIVSCEIAWLWRPLFRHHCDLRRSVEQKLPHMWRVFHRASNTVNIFTTTLENWNFRLRVGDQPVTS